MVNTLSLAVDMTQPVRPWIEKRAFPRVRCRAQARLRRPESGHQVLVQLRDLSQGGAGLVVTDPPQVGEIVELELRGGDAPSGWVREAEVRWLEPIDADHWRIGCSWIHRLGYAELLRLIW